MNFMTKQWFIGILIVVILAIIVDGFRRMRKARQDSLQMSLKPDQESTPQPKNSYGREFPNGGARSSAKGIDKDRIQQLRSQYDFGRNMSEIIEEAKDKLREEQQLSGQDQWVDEDDGDVEYYARKWDDEYDKYDELDQDDRTIEDAQSKYAVEDERIKKPEQYEELPEEGNHQEFGEDGSFRESLNPCSKRKEPSAKEVHEELLVEEVPKELLEEVENPLSKLDQLLEKTPEPKELVFQLLEDEADIATDSKLKEPQQASLNLEETVPVLMETVDDAEEGDKSLQENLFDEANDSEQDDAQENEQINAKEEIKKGTQNQGQIIPDLGAEDFSIRSVGKHIQRAAEPAIGSSADISATEADVEKRSAEKNAVEKSRTEEVIEKAPELAENLKTRSANKPKYQSKYFSSDDEQKATTSTISEVLVINVRAGKNQQLQGSDLLEQVLENGLRYGAMNIFHYHEGEDGEGPVLFSMANMLKPGTFDLQSIDSFTTVGVTFFLTLPVVNDQHMAAYESMLATAKNVAAVLNADLNDDQRSVMTSQTMEHYRERIRDFSRRQQLEKNK